MVRYDINFITEVVDEEMKKLCAEDMPCTDFIREAVITVLKTFPLKIIRAEVCEIIE